MGGSTESESDLELESVLDRVSVALRLLGLVGGLPGHTALAAVRHDFCLVCMSHTYLVIFEKV